MDIKKSLSLSLHYLVLTITPIFNVGLCSVYTLLLISPVNESFHFIHIFLVYSAGKLIYQTRHQILYIFWEPVSVL